jgi:hypothetical protein
METIRWRTVDDQPPYARQRQETTEVKTQDALRDGMEAASRKALGALISDGADISG